MLTTGDTQRLLTGGATLVDEGGEPLGTVDDVFLDGTTGRPAWAAVTVGRLRKHTAYVPLGDATRDGDAFRVPVTHDAVTHAPRVVSTEGRLDPEAEHELSRHYGLVPSVATDGPGPVHDEAAPPREVTTAGPAGSDDAQPGTIDPLRRHADEDGIPRDAPPTVTPPPPPGDLVEEYPLAPPSASAPPVHPYPTSDQPGTTPEAGERR